MVSHLWKCPGKHSSLRLSPGGSVIKNCLLQYRRHRFDPWVGKIALEEGMATHCSIVAPRILWTEEPGGLQSMGSQRVGHD